MKNTVNENSAFLELNIKEMKEIEGGNPLALAFGLYILWETAANPVESWKAFKKGWDSVH